MSSKKKSKPSVHKYSSQFVIFVIDGCIFSEKSKKIIKESKLKHTIINVPTDKKAFYKKAHQMETFPQVFYHTKSGTIIKVGGSDDLENLLTIIRNQNKV